MTYPVLAPGALPCVWMRAGLLSYRLCDRAFDCESCPLDAALRRAHGEEAVEGVPGPVAAEAFPDDRSYAPGHTWVRPTPSVGAPRYRFGLDALGAALLGEVRAVRCRSAGRALEAGHLLCELELGAGTLSLGCPVRGRPARANPLLRELPERAVVDPYGDGWIAELVEVDPAEVRLLAGGPAARERTERDLVRFRRDVALRLFGGLRAGGTHWRGPGRRLTDLRELLGAAGHLELIAGFVR